MQVESSVSPMKYLLVLCCLFFWGQMCGEGRERGTLRRSAWVMGAQLNELLELLSEASVLLCQAAQLGIGSCEWVSLCVNE